LGKEKYQKYIVGRKENNNPIKTDFILSLTNDRGVIPYSEKGDVGNKSKTDISGYKLAYPGDIILNSMNIIIGSVGLSKYYGAVSPVYYVLYPHNENISIEYFNYVFQTKEFQNNLRGYGNGIMEIRMRIQMSKLNTISIPCPPFNEQRKIANYLDSIVSIIDNLIQYARMSVEEYRAFKKSLITESVMHGINSKSEMKDTTVAYIERIPKDWEIRRIKFVLTPLDRDVLDTDEVITCFRDGTVTLRKNRRDDGYTFSDTENGYQGVEIGDLVIHGMDAFAGAIGISDSRGKCTPVVHVCASKENKNYFMYYLRALAMNDVLMAFTEGIRIRSSDLRNWNKFAKFMVVVPPQDEQERIADYLDEKCLIIDDIIDQKQKLIEELLHYKKALIYECVTGKMEVV
jgi:type I restriction enzyme S subunit